MNDKNVIELFEIFKEYFPKFKSASNYVEEHDRITPQQAFIEGRDILSHIYDISISLDNDEKLKENIIEIKEHFRRGVAESYQEHYEYIAADVYQDYSTYKKRLRPFEKLLRLYKIHKPIHEEVRGRIKQSQDLWIKGRSLKTKDLNSDKFDESINLFIQANDTIEPLSELVNELWNNFYQRSTYVGLTLVALIITSVFLLNYCL
ncbi:hypothetical protein [Marinoscillum sp. 108]|uniref:hypothetical protein n=1 Tax=Marinoscillum sp. 108 TaxID=2653151 RepID=UPI0012F19591|nr:hypothetical protein [Marinoscillum sp. 108]VXD19574.1 conserved hypothetical protein [Marinoscillum sp. 108]